MFFQTGLSFFLSQRGRDRRGRERGEEGDRGDLLTFSELRF